MIDTHAHIDFEQYDSDRAQTLQRAFSGGVEKIINVGADLAGSQKSVELASENDDIFAAVGLHPHEFNAGKILDMDVLKELAKNKKVVAIGEIGLDYFSHTVNLITPEQKENQKKGFVAQIELAKESNLPVIIHCRDAYEDLYKILQTKNYLPTGQAGKLKTVFHCYGGDLAFTQKLLQHDNILFSFTGNITYAKDKSEIIGVIKAIPIDKIMLETDCPYLTPVPHRGKRNEPAHVSYVNEKIAEIKQISAKEVDRMTTENAKKFFELA